jgi:hypothetical protein
VNIPSDISDLTDTENLLGANPFDQALNTTDSVSFSDISSPVIITGDVISRPNEYLYISSGTDGGSNTNVAYINQGNGAQAYYSGTHDFTQATVVGLELQLEIDGGTAFTVHSIADLEIDGGGA